MDNTIHRGLFLFEDVFGEWEQIVNRGMNNEIQWG